jgi:hypothetical protein
MLLGVWAVTDMIYHFPLFTAWDISYPTSVVTATMNFPTEIKKGAEPE